MSVLLSINQQTKLGPNEWIEYFYPQQSSINQLKKSSGSGPKSPK